MITWSYNYGGGANGTSTTSPNLGTLTANYLYLIAVTNYASGATPNTPTISDSSGRTWTQVATVVNGNYRTTVFRSLETSDRANCTITIDYAGQTNAIKYILQNASGVDTSGTNGSGAIVQSQSNSQAGSFSGITVTMNAFGSSNNSGFGAMLLSSGSAVTVGSGFTSLLNDNWTFTNCDEYKTNSGNINWTWASESSTSVAIGIEVKAGGTTYTQTLTETVSLTDTLTKMGGKVLTETINHTDTVIKMTGRVLSDTVSLSDSLVKMGGKVLSDTISLSDTLIKMAGKVLSDTVNFTDTIASKITAKILTETVNLTDTLSKVSSRILIETINLTDTLSIVFNNIASQVLRHLKDSVREIKKLNQPTGAVIGDTKPTGGIRGNKPEGV